MRAAAMRSGPWPVLLMVGSVAGMVAGPPSSARAQAGDGVYGRLDGDLTLALDVGAGAAVADAAAPLFVLDARARYLDAAGLVLGASLGPSAEAHALVELRPLFPVRFLLDASSGSELLDLTLESVGLELGVALLPLGPAAGAALCVGLGVEVPVIPPSVWARGLWLRLGARHVHATQGLRGGPLQESSAWLLSATLGLRLVTHAGLSTREPPRYRLE